MNYFHKTSKICPKNSLTHLIYNRFWQQSKTVGLFLKTSISWRKFFSVVSTLDHKNVCLFFVLSRPTHNAIRGRLWWFWVLRQSFIPSFYRSQTNTKIANTFFFSKNCSFMFCLISRNSSNLTPFFFQTAHYCLCQTIKKSSTNFNMNELCEKFLTTISTWSRSLIHGSANQNGCSFEFGLTFWKRLVHWNLIINCGCEN